MSAFEEEIKFFLNKKKHVIIFKVLVICAIHR
jgi:hypothetical protein